jgi:hypothetical protein
MTVWVLQIEHKHGDDISVYASEEAALNAVGEYVRTWWNDMLVDGIELSMPESRDEAIEEYFEEMSNVRGREHYSILPCEVLE